MKNLQPQNNEVFVGNVYVMTHSLFSDIIRIGCTPGDLQEYVKSLSAKSPGDYTVVFSLQCDNPCQVKKRTQEQLQAQMYVKEFYQTPIILAKRLLKRESLMIQKLNIA